MLMITMPIVLLLITKTKWNHLSTYLTLITVISPVIIYSLQHPSMLNTMMGLDSMSAMLILLTMWITPMMITASQKIMLKGLKPHVFSSLVMILNITLVWSFSVNNIIMFYILFEVSLIPTLLIIMKWGYQPERLQASMYLMMYTITASLPLLTGIMYFLYSYYNLFLINTWFSDFLPPITWLIMNTAFLVKLPLFFFHLWLPKAHVEAPVAGSMILAAVLLKLGGYGMLRMFYLMPPINCSLKMILTALAMWGGMITSLICVRQQDMKSLIAYSSVGHMSFVIIGAASGMSWGLFGAMTMMISHGLLSSAMFAAADMTYNMSNSRSLIINKGLNITIPTMSMLWFIMSAANMAAPPSSNLMAEIMLITMSANISKIMLLPVSIMSFTAAAYSLTLYVALNHGPLNSFHLPAHSLNPRNFMVILSHVIPIVTIMLMPALILFW